jgi:cation transport ATPase
MPQFPLFSMKAFELNKQPSFQQATEQQLLWAAAACEASSEHPLAKAIIAAASKLPPPALTESFEAQVGCGVR